jgi:hypothetical protein
MLVKTIVDNYSDCMNRIITIKNIQNSMLQLEIHYFPILSLIIFLGIGMCICLVNINSIYAQTEDSSNAEQKSEDNKDLTTIKVKMNKNNLNISNHDRLKIVGYLNGEGQIKYVNLKEMDKDKLLSSNTTEKSLTVNLNFNQSNEISSVMVGDEYYICAYVLDDSEKPSKIATTDPIPLFDCMEGTIGKSTSAGTITLFPTMKKYGESKAFYTANDNTTNDSKEVKITINVPIHDAKDIDDMNVVAMVKGDYKIKTIDVQKELEEGNNNKKDQILVPFTFNRQTEVGYIQPGDLFFGCATSDEFPGQNSKCEKRMLKDLDKINKLCARKDSSC